MCVIVVVVIAAVVIEKEQTELESIVSTNRLKWPKSFVI